MQNIEDEDDDSSASDGTWTRFPLIDFYCAIFKTIDLRRDAARISANQSAGRGNGFGQAIALLALCLWGSRQKENLDQIQGTLPTSS